MSDGARDDLWIARADGSMPRTLLDCRDECRYLDDPAWSPNGAQVVYSRRSTRGSTEVGSLETVDVATGAVTMLLPPRFRRFTAGARWSPYGGEPRQLTHPADAGGYAQEPDWSGGGSRIVFSGRLADRAGSPVLLVVPADGSVAPADLGATSVIGRHPRVEPGA